MKKSFSQILSENSSGGAVSAGNIASGPMAGFKSQLFAIPQTREPVQEDPTVIKYFYVAPADRYDDILTGIKENPAYPTYLHAGLEQAQDFYRTRYGRIQKVVFMVSVSDPGAIFDRGLGLYHAKGDIKPEQIRFLGKML